MSGCRRPTARRSRRCRRGATGSGSRAITIRRCRPISAAWSRAKSRSARSCSATSRPALRAKSPAICIPRRGSPTRGRSMERRCFASDGERAVMPAFGAYTGGLSIRDMRVRENLRHARLHGACARRQPRARDRGVAVLLSGHTHHLILRAAQRRSKGGHEPHGSPSDAEHRSRHDSALRTMRRQLEPPSPAPCCRTRPADPPAAMSRGWHRGRPPMPFRFGRSVRSHPSRSARGDRPGSPSRTRC